MKSAALIAAVLLAGLSGLVDGGDPAGEMVAQGAKLENRRAVSIVVRNAGTTAGAYTLPAGSIFETAGHGRAVVLRSSRTPLPVGGEADLLVPVAMLSLNNNGGIAGSEPSTKATPSTQTEPRLAGLLSYLEKQTDVPRGTSQCAVFALLEDLTFAQWQHWLAGGQAAPATPPGAGGVAEALDAIAILREIAPQQSFRLQQDEELKMRALHQPGLRGKAAGIFGMTIPGDPPPAGLAPSVGQLLHTKPGDDCPICRMRGQMQKAVGDL